MISESKIHLHYCFLLLAHSSKIVETTDIVNQDDLNQNIGINVVTEQEMNSNNNGGSMNTGKNAF